MTMNQDHKEGVLLEFTAKFNKTQASPIDKIRMEWQVSNKSQAKIVIIGYYSPFYFQDNLQGVYLADKKTWSTNEFMISNDHVTMQLWPKESRKYIWDSVTPDYYGMTKFGRWDCKPVMFYQIVRQMGVFRAESPKATISIAERREPSLSDRALKDLHTKLDLVLHLLQPWDDELQPYLDESTSREFQTTKTSHVDFLVQDPSAFVVIEIKRSVRLTDLGVMKINMDWIEKLLGRKYGKRIRGILIGERISRDVIASSRKYDVKLFRFRPMDRRIMLVPVEIPNEY